MPLATNLTKSLTLRYVLALSLIATLVTTSYVTLETSISEQESTAAIVNISGRQRMLSQRIALFSQGLMNSQSASAAILQKKKLSAAIELMEYSHKGLTQGSKRMGLPSGMSEDVRHLYFSPPDAVDKNVRTYLASAKKVLNLPREDYSLKNSDLEIILEIGPGQLLVSLDRLVKQYQREGEAAVARLATIELIVWLMALGLLVLEVLLIFRPMVRKVSQHVDALKASEERFDAISQGSTDTIILAVDDSGKIVFWNAAAENSFGYKKEEIIGKPLNGIIPSRFYEAHSTAFDLAKRKGEVGKNSISRELTALRKNGEEFPIEISIGLWREGKQMFFTGIARDISDRKKSETKLRESEERFRAIAESTADWIWEVDENAAYTFATSRVGTVLGYQPSEILGKTPFDLMPPEEAKRVGEEFGKIVSGPYPFRNLENTNIHRKGHLVVLETSGVPFFSSDGEFKGYRGVDRDITQRKEIERHLAQGQKMEAVGQLTGGIAHDFNNLLHVIQGNLELARSKAAEGKDVVKHLDSASAAGKRGATLTQQLLSYSRKQILHPEPVHPIELTNGFLKLLKRTLGEDIEIETNFGEDTPLITVDPNAFENAILNISINAKAAMPKGGKMIISLSNVILDKDIELSDDVLPAGEYMEFSLTDSGTGMSSATLDRAFEPFFTTKEVGEGSGLGLSMVYGFVKQSGGHASIESEGGKGTTVRMMFPATDGITDNIEVEQETIGASSSGTILIVEDEPDVREISTSLLENLGYNVIAAEDGVAALEILKNEDIYLLFTDVVMPKGINGVELAEQALLLRKDIKVLLTSGYPDVDLKRSGLSERDLNLLRKPYSTKELSEALRNVIED